jgi:VCBS repeat-containing protein
VLANDADVDGDALTALLVTGPQHGVLALSPDGAFSYTPAANYNGPDSFTYRASDGQSVSAVATVALTITPVNDAPVAHDDAYQLRENTSLTVPARGVLANDTDIDGDPLTAVIVTGPTHGALTLNSDGSFTYTPTLNYHGTETFSYRASDGHSQSNPATVELTITSANRPPTIVPVPDQRVFENRLMTLQVSATDPDAGQVLAFSLAPGAPTGAEIDPRTGVFRWTPSEAQGPNAYSITVVVSDGTLTDTSTFKVRVDESIEGTNRADRFELTQSGDVVKAIVNGTTQLLRGVDRVALIGMDGNDTFWIDGVRVDVLVDAGAGNDGALVSPSANSAGRVTLLGGAGDDLLVGGPGNDLLDGGEGNDVLLASAGSDTLLGGPGNDAFLWYAGQGSTTFDGGPGDDQVILLGSPRADVVSVTAGDGAVKVSWLAPSPAQLSMKAVEHLDIRTGGGHDAVRVDPLATSSLQSLTVAGGPGRDLGDGAGPALRFLLSGGDDARSVRPDKDSRGRIAGGEGDSDPARCSNLLEFAYAEADEAPSRGLSPRILWSEDGERRH